MPIFSETRRNLRWRIARAFRDLPYASGSLATPTTAGFWAPALFFAKDSDVKGAEVSFYGGGGASIAGDVLGAARIIVAGSPAASFATHGWIAVQPYWGVAPSTNSGWEIHRQFSRLDYEDAITRAHWRGARRMTTPAEEYFVGNAWLRNSAFDIWLAGTTSAPTGWTLGGTGATVAQATAVPYGGRRYAALLSDGSNIANLTQTGIDWHRFAGKSVTLKAIVSTVTASRVFIRANDGSNHDSSNHTAVPAGTGQGLWQELSVTFTVSNTPTDMACSLQISAGSAVTANIARMWLESESMYDVPVENRWFAIASVDEEEFLNTWVSMPDEFWFINKDRSPREIGFIERYVHLQTGKLYRAVGQVYPTDPAETENLPIDPEYIFNRAAATLYRQLPKTEGVSGALAQDAAQWERQADLWERKTSRPPAWGSKIVEEM